MSGQSSKISMENSLTPSTQSTINMIKSEDHENNSKSKSPTQSRQNQSKRQSELFDEVRSNLDEFGMARPNYFKGHRAEHSIHSTVSQYSGQIVEEPVSLAINKRDIVAGHNEDGLKRGLSLVKANSSAETQNVPLGDIEQESEMVSANTQPPQPMDKEITERRTSAVSDMGPRLSRGGVSGSKNSRAESRHSAQFTDTDVDEGFVQLETHNKVATTPTSSYSDDSDGCTRLKPDLITTTNIEQPVPPRSSRRPKSMVIETGNSTFLAGEKRRRNKDRKRSSMSVTEGLDELMKSASIAQRENFPSLSPTVSQREHRSHMKNSNSSSIAGSIDSITNKNWKSMDSDEKLRYETSHDSFRTADGSQVLEPDMENVSAAALAVSKVQVGSSIGDKVRKTQLPPRPTVDNLRRAREVSQQISLQESLKDKSMNSEKSLEECEITTERPISSTFHHEKDISNCAESLFSDEKALSTPRLNSPGECFVTPSTGAERDSADEQSDEKPLFPSKMGKVGVPPLVIPPSMKARTSHNDIGAESMMENANTTLSSGATEIGTASKAISVGNRRKESQIIVDEDGFYDIEGEEEIVTKPGRVKSVKASTNKEHKRKSGKPKKKNRASASLKPFTYQTLISLLESTNGTVIGEEFSQLDLPVKEKQLIEKIIDALSRLSADMVLDKDRYEVGIKRLENALRVLEGFL